MQLTQRSDPLEANPFKLSKLVISVKSYKKANANERILLEKLAL